MEGVGEGGEGKKRKKGEKGEGEERKRGGRRGV